MKNLTKQKILVAMSGGVDSSVAAALLMQQGYNIEGATIEMWPEGDPLFTGVTGNSAPCSKSAVTDAQRVAKTLGITHHVLDFSEKFLTKVVDNFVEEYLVGRTPNPCVVCNREIKFGAFLELADALGADLVATGHYARITFDDSSGRYLLKKAKDASKDQTYVLYSLSQKQLSRAIFPLGGYSKTEIRQLALDFNLPVAEKAESQDICFIPDNDYRRFLMEKLGDGITPGPFLDIDGNVIGQHRGISFYTIGQRRGLGLALGYPAYVVAIDVQKNAVIVGTENHLFSKRVLVKDNNFILFDNLEEPVEAAVKIRYNAEAAEAVISPGGEPGLVQVVFEKSQKAVTPGQSAVYYQGDTVIGGGIIERALG